MDSLSQIALGSAVAVAALGRRTAVWKAVAWGALCGTLPDLDAFIEHGDPVRNMTLHRAESHALFWLTLVSLPIAALARRADIGGASFRRWWLAVWLALVTHPLLDVMTVYGTQLGLPFTDHPYAVGSVFIIDPLYTLPLLVGVGAVLAGRRLAWNGAGLAGSTLYLAWSFAAQQHVHAVAVESLAAEGVAAPRLLVTPSPFNTVLWRVVRVTPESYSEGFYSLLDADRRIAFHEYARGAEHDAAWRGVWTVDRMAWFTRGFYRLGIRDGQVVLTDLRMGQEPSYTFNFVVGREEGGRAFAATPRQITERPDVATALPLLWRRLLGDRPAPP